MLKPTATMTDQPPADPHAVPDSVAGAVADAMFALSAPSRVQLLSRLRTRPHTVGELVAAVGMEQSAVSHQLRLLREHGLVVSERRGRERVYALSDEHVGWLLDAAVAHVGHLAQQSRRPRRGARRAS